LLDVLELELPSPCENPLELLLLVSALPLPESAEEAALPEVGEAPEALEELLPDSPE
jgi:hypothetical protein